MGWLEDFRQDLQRYVREGGSPGKALLTHQGLWALLEYRLAREVRRLPLMGPVFVVWQKAVEATTGISIGHGARIGPGLLIGHFGGIIVHDEAVLGSQCHLCQGVTIGRGICREGYGVPVIGDGVYVGPHATVLGSITIGDRARIAANTVVTESLPPEAYAHPAPVAVEPSFVGYCEGTLGVSPSR
jgi:serine O-acetyltransferase